MAATKLTLRLEEEIIQRGKLIAKAQQTSLSKLVEQLLREVIVREESNQYPYIIDPDPFINSIALNEPMLAEPDDPARDRAAYYAYLSNKGDE